MESMQHECEPPPSSKPRSQLDRARALVAQCAAGEPPPANAMLTLLEESNYGASDRTISEYRWRALRDLALAAMTFNAQLALVRRMFGA